MEGLQSTINMHADVTHESYNLGGLLKAIIVSCSRIEFARFVPFYLGILGPQNARH